MDAAEEYRVTRREVGRRSEVYPIDLPFVEVGNFDAGSQLEQSEMTHQKQPNQATRIIINEAAANAALGRTVTLSHCTLVTSPSPNAVRPVAKTLENGCRLSRDMSYATIQPRASSSSSLITCASIRTAMLPYHSTKPANLQNHRAIWLNLTVRRNCRELKALTSTTLNQNRKLHA